MAKKVRVKEKTFLDWYFYDHEDMLSFANNMITELHCKGFIKESVQSLLSSCGYIPGHITENPDDENEYDPSDIELISNRIPGHCHKCGEKYDNSMDNYCSVCLESK